MGCRDGYLRMPLHTRNDPDVGLQQREGPNAHRKAPCTICGYPGAHSATAVCAKSTIMISDSSMESHMCVTGRFEAEGKEQ